MLDSSVGRRVAVERKLAGLTQAQLAQRTNYSVSTVRAVEQRREPASMAFVAACARALGIELEQLTGQPYKALLEEDGGLPGLAELRALFAEGPYVEPVPPPAVAELAAELAEVRRLRRVDNARAALARLPVLLRQLHGAAHDAGSAAERERVNTMLTHAYAAAQLACYRFGYISLAITSVDRMDVFAQRSDDPLLPAYTLIQRAHMLMSSASYGPADAIAGRALHALRDAGDDEGALALRGFAHLRAAIINARNWNPNTAREHIEQARVFGDRIGHTSYLYDTSMGPGNVAIHDVGVSLESGDAGRAARDGSALRLPADVQPTRVGRHWMDTARAWTLEGQPDKALKALHNARLAAPQQTKLHPNAQETIRAIAAAERRRSTSLANFVRWMGLTL